MTMFDRALDKLVERMIRGCEIIIVSIGIWLMVAMIASVFFRYVLNSSLTWADESSSFLLVWLMLAVAPIGFHENFHVAVSLVVDRVPRLVRVFLGLFINSCTALLFGIAGYYGIDQTIIEMGTELASMPISRAWFTWALPAGSVAVLLVCLNNMLRILRQGDVLNLGEESFE
jgi:TRAP-type C4-dicarboxylate transport system permease small subunit